MEGCFHGKQGRAVIKFNSAVWPVRASNHGVVEIFAASRHMRGNLASGSPVLGSVCT
jgi:hypothetical protein